MSLNYIKLLKSKALELLCARKNYIELILAFIIASTFCIIPIVVCSLTSELLDETIFTIVLLCIEVFISIPIFSGIYRMIGKACRNKEYGLVDIFFAFTSTRNYFRVIFMNIISFLKYVTPISIGFILSITLRDILGNFNILYELVAIIVGVFMAAVILVLLPLCNRFYAVRFLVTAEDYDIIGAIKRSWRITKRKAIKLTSLNFSLLPILLISVVALLVPLVIYTFPFLICVYSVACRRLLREEETNKILIESQNDICPEADAAGVEEINE